jgi:hypothetical protein
VELQAAQNSPGFGGRECLIEGAGRVGRQIVLHNPPSTLTSVEEINDRIVSLASAGGEDPYVARVLIGIMAGSQLTLLAGVRAASLARTVAYSIGGAASCIVPIAPTMFSVADMLNAPTTPIAGVACPGETLGQFLLQVMQQDRLSVVVLQGGKSSSPGECTS